MSFNVSTLNEDLGEIRRLLTEAYEHYFANSDGHCKSSEGAISLHFPAFFWRADRATLPTVEIYSYVLGPHRSHHFKNSAEALREVRKWHAAEMMHDYSGEMWGEQ